MYICELDKFTNWSMRNRLLKADRCLDFVRTGEKESRISTLYIMYIDRVQE